MCRTKTNMAAVRHSEWAKCMVGCTLSWVQPTTPVTDCHLGSPRGLPVSYSSASVPLDCLVVASLVKITGHTGKATCYRLHIPSL